MYIVLYSCILLLTFHFSRAVYLNVTLQDEDQSFTVYEDDYNIVLKIYDNHDEIIGNDCNGSCSVKNWILGSTCNLPDHRYMNVLMDVKAKITYSGRWKCSFMASGKVYTVTFNLNVKEIVLSMLPKEIIPPVLTLPPKPIDTGFNINAMEAKNHITLNEGDQTVNLKITGIDTKIGIGNCEKGSCTITKTKQEIPTTNCTNVGNFLNVELTSIKVTQAHAGIWECSFSLLQKNANIELKQVQIPITVSVKSPATEAVGTDKWIFIGAGLAVLGLIIIVQTMFILYFKAKAKKAEMVKNLTPTKTSSEPDMRYVKNQKGSDEMVRESGIYEALETVTGRAPIPPPIETLPVTPNPLSRSMSTQHLSTKKPEPWQSRTNTRPNQKKPNPVDDLKTLERIKNRPPLPLPTPEEIYEVMTPEASPTPTKASSRFNKNKAEQSPLLARQQMPLFGKSSPIAPVQNQRVPVSTPGRMPPLGPPGAGPPSTASGPNVTLKMPAPFGHPLQGNMVRPPFGPGGQLPGPSGRAPAGAMPVMGAMPVLPSMISASKLKPVKQSGGPPTSDPMKNTSAGFRMPHANGPRVTPGGPRMPGDSPRTTHGIGPSTLGDNSRMTPAQSNIAKLGPVPPFKPKPPIPLPELYEMEPSHDPESYYGSSDEEFDCYDVLPEYRIYGNTAPKKIN